MDNQIEQIVKVLKSAILLQETDLVDISKVDAKLKDVADLSNYIYTNLTELRKFSLKLSQGHVDIESPKRNNLLAGEIKNLQSSINHLCWQIGQVADGDYSQKVVFLGGFTESFSKLTKQLNDRELLIEENLKQKEEQIKHAEEVNNFVNLIIDKIDDAIIITEASDRKKIFFSNEAGNLLFDADKCTAKCELAINNDGHCNLLLAIQKYELHENNSVWEHGCCKDNIYYQIHTHYFKWNGEYAYAHIISDISQFKNTEASLIELSNKDSMTGANNRRHFTSRLNKLVYEKRYFTLCYVDIDKLKYVNDVFGHKFGDNYIQKVVNELTSVFRGRDDICRIGGDEFAILLENCSEEVTIKKMDQVQELLVADKSNGYPMSISYGVHFVDSNNTLLPSEIMDVADEKMYTQKKSK